MSRQTKTVPLLLCIALIFGIWLFIQSQPERHEETLIDQTMHGLIVEADGTCRTCEIAIQGTRISYPEKSTNPDSIRLADNGGITVDGVSMDLGHIVFINRSDPDSLCHYVGIGTYLISANGDYILGISETDQTLLIAPASTQDEAILLIDSLRSLPHTSGHPDFFSEITALLSK